MGPACHVGERQSECKGKGIYFILQANLHFFMFFEFRVWISGGGRGCEWLCNIIFVKKNNLFYRILENIIYLCHIFLNCINLRTTNLLTK